ncbi:MAG: hypothetical protein FWF34_01475 [Alphaproteobacteria bacterium]|nr:hypothetical protein [Alphaproteobacteria bacterium]MCL2889911.1 hypothetical protein [Alphaproteobacteria bacterium]
MTNIEKFNNLAGFYEYMKTVMSAIATQKGGVPIENYAGRFFAADTLEMLVAMGGKIGTSADEKTRGQIEKYRAEFAEISDWVTPSKKPVHEMTLEEFEKVMNI